MFNRYLKLTMVNTLWYMTDKLFRLRSCWSGCSLKETCEPVIEFTMVNRVHLEHTFCPCKHRFLPRLIPYMARGERGYSWKLLVGLCRPVLKILTLFQTKKTSFFAPVFRPGLWKEIMSSLLRLVQQQRDFLNSISNSHISLSFLLICWDTLLSCYPPNVGVQDLVVNCDNQHWEDEETGGSVPTISVWNCSFYYRSVWADL